MSEEPSGPARFKSMPVSSARPKWSIFSLRPSSHTERPPTESIDIIGAPAPAKQPRRTLPLLVAGIVLASGVFGGWMLVRSKKPTHRERVVTLNGAPTAKTTSAGSVQRWPNTEVTIHIDQSFDGLGPEAIATVQHAFGTWLESGAKLPALRFDTTSGKTPSLEPDGINTVAFVPLEVEGHKNDLAVTIGFTDDTGRIVEADVFVNSKRKFGVLSSVGNPSGEEDDQGSSACDGRYDLQSVVTHEAGHFFGLDEDKVEGTSTMFFKTKKCETLKRDLEPPDRTVMASVYQGELAPGAETDTGGGCGGASISVAVPGGAGSAALLLAAGLGLGLRRRPSRSARG